jgi:DNA gyrase inhibitor GyrI
MDVKEFVRETLRQIVEWVREARIETADKCQIAPVGDQREKVEFDIAVTVDEEQTKEKGAGVSVWALKAGTTGQSTVSTNTVHRIKVSVPIDFESEAEQEQRDAKSREEYRKLAEEHRRPL